jgi:hypothetical protein
MIIAILVGIGGGLIYYKHNYLGFPLMPDERENVWSVEAKINFDADGKPVNAKFAVPGDQKNLKIIEETFASVGYGYHHEDDKPGHGIARRAVWTQRAPKGPQTIYYRVVLHKKFVESKGKVKDDFSSINLPDYNELQESAVKNLIAEAERRSADKISFTTELLKLINSTTPSQDVLLVLNHDDAPKSKATATAGILNYHGIRTYILYGFALNRSMVNAKLVPFITFEQDGEYVVFNMKTGERELDNNILIWQRGNEHLLEVKGAKNEKVSFSVVKSSWSAFNLAKKSAESENSILVDFSIYTLPLEQEASFLMLMMVPLGALVVVIVRSLIGIPTSGTFMPILLAIAFSSTDLIPGIIMFSIIVTLGLIVRTYLSKLDLLLVPRISAVVVVVIVIMAMVTILSQKLGFEHGLKAAFFPVIILSWTVERLSIICEEDGTLEAIRLIAGSVFVAIWIYLIMDSSFIRFWLFNYSEVVLLILALILLLGQYTGYRLIELMRFAALVKKKK